MRNGAVLAVLVVYLPRCRRKKKVMHAMLAMVMVPADGDAMAMLSAWCKILSGIGHTQLGTGLMAWKPQSSWVRQKSVAPRWLSQGSGVPRRVSIWPTEQRAFSTV